MSQTTMQAKPEVVHDTPAKNHRFLLLDALRGIVALLVVAWHLPAFANNGRRFPNGFLAVDFFFCLSGFVVAFAYERRLKEGLPLRDFLVARLIRLYPLYLLGLVLGLVSTLLFAHITSDPRTSPMDAVLVVLFGVAMIPNFLAHWPISTSFPLNSPSWSLFYELAVNFFFAGLAVFTRIKSVVLMALCLISLGGLLLGLLNQPSVDVGAYPDTFFLGFARVGFSFFAGVLVFRSYRDAGSPKLAGISHRVIPWLITTGLLFFLLASFPFTRSPTFQILCLILIFPATVYLGACSRIAGRYDRLCGLVGDLSYPIYILHYPLVFVFTGRKMRLLLTRHTVVSAAMLPAVCLVVIAVSFCASEFYDKPIRGWLTRRYNAWIKRCQSQGSLTG